MKYSDINAQSHISSKWMWLCSPFRDVLALTDQISVKWSDYLLWHCDYLFWCTRIILSDSLSQSVHPRIARLKASQLQMTQNMAAHLLPWSEIQRIYHCSFRINLELFRINVTSFSWVVLDMLSGPRHLHIWFLQSSPQQSWGFRLLLWGFTLVYTDW